MARDTSPRGRLERRLNRDLKRFNSEDRKRKIRLGVLPGGKTPNKPSDYKKQQEEKQLVKALYGFTEKPFRNRFEKAKRSKHGTGLALLSSLECCLDNVVYLGGFAPTLRQARQLVSHRAIEVNGKIVNVRSYTVRPGDCVTITERAQKQGRILESIAVTKEKGESPYSWLSVDFEKMSITVKRPPIRSDIDSTIKEWLIVELYSKS